MICRVRPHATAILLVASTLACLIATSSARASHGPPPPPAVAAMLPSASLGSGFCGIVGNQRVGVAAEAAIERGRGLYGSLIGAVVVAVVQRGCPQLMTAAAAVVRKILVTRRPSLFADISTLAAYRQQFAALQAGTIAARLRTSAAYVRRARDRVCNAFHRAQNTGSVVVDAFANATLAHLSAMHAFVRMVIDSCNGFTKAAANYLTGVVLNLVLDNRFRGDLDPPIALVLSTSGRRTGGGRALVSARFLSFDRSGVRSCDIELWYAGAWHPRSGPCTAHSAYLASGTRYAWAFRALDRAGHRSQWSVTGYGTA
jgi:hypothetical protein